MKPPHSASPPMAGGGALSQPSPLPVQAAKGPHPPPACVQVHLPDGRIHSFALNGTKISIGRSCQNDLAIADLALSKRHAIIEAGGEQFLLFDAGSRNGTFLNDVRLREPATLAHGDEIRMGSCRLYFFSEAVISSMGDPLSDITTQIGLAPHRPDPAGYEEPTGFTFSQQLALARIIQKFLLPACNPDLPGYQIYADTQPCYAVGGDFYDFQHLDDGAFYFLLGDVARKGIPAAMMAHYSQALIRGGWKYERDLSTLMSWVNREIWVHSPPNQFVTMCIFQMKPETGEVCYVNAGHCPPLLMHPSGEAEWLGSGSLVLGVLADVAYECTRAKIPPGGMLVLYSDGVTECRCEEGNEFGQQRLAEFFRQRRSDPLDALIVDLEAELQNYCAGPMLEDDLTLLFIRREPQA